MSDIEHELGDADDVNATQGEAVSREELVERLAAVSHQTWMRQAERDKGETDLDPAVTDHDRERAEDTVVELERLGIVRWSV